MFCILQGSVGTRGGQYNNSIVANFLLSPAL